jgi:hypothetical protein
MLARWVNGSVVQGNGLHDHFVLELAAHRRTVFALILRSTIAPSSPSVLAGQSRAVSVPGAARCTACPGIREALIEPFPPAQIVFQVTRNWPKPPGLGGHLGNSPRSR